GVEMRAVTDESYLAIWHAVEDGRAAKEAIPVLLRGIAGGSTVEAALAELAPVISRAELETIVRTIIAASSDFVKEKGRAALGPLMGLVMEEVRGSVDGKLVSEVLRKEIDAAVAGK
ncbi:MAG: GatB/YqeY domain-containing protein, partial [Methanomicrobiales archaeon]